MHGGEVNQGPSESDAIMASALLSISRKGAANVSTVSITPEFPLNNGTAVPDNVTAPTLDLVSKSGSGLTRKHQTGEFASDLHFNIAVQKIVVDATKTASLNHILSSSSSIQPFQSHLSQMAHLHASELLHTSFYSSPMHYVGSVDQTVQATLKPGFEKRAEHVSIRQKEIEKALQSKSQRGRKRANLNDGERLELTRTRNREHAKSTRIRKKLRYEELVDCEAKIRVMEVKEDLDHRRRCCVVSFIAIREQMLQEQIQEQSLLQVEPPLTQRLFALFQDGSNVTYEDHVIGSENLTTIECMKKFDQLVLSRVHPVDEQVLPSISYRMKDPDVLNSVATSRNGTALLEVDVVHTIRANDCHLLLSFLLKFTFGPESDKIQSISLVPCGYDIETRNTIQSSHGRVVDGARQNLVEQISYPSVVSLDVERENMRTLSESEVKRCESDEGIGMSF